MSEPLRRLVAAVDKHYPLLAGRVIGLEHSGETVAYSAWSAAVSEIYKALTAAQAALPQTTTQGLSGHVIIPKSYGPASDGGCLDPRCHCHERIKTVVEERNDEERYHNGFRDDLWAALGVTEFKRLSDADQIQAVADLRARLAACEEQRTREKLVHEEAEDELARRAQDAYDKRDAALSAQALAERETEEVRTTLCALVNQYREYWNDALARLAALRRE